jgi:hypothetical protein
MRVALSDPVLNRGDRRCVHSSELFRYWRVCLTTRSPSSGLFFIGYKKEPTP